MEIAERVRRCRLCEAQLPLGARPVFQFHPQAPILLVGQAPGRRVHETGLPFNDPSGDRLRQWLGVDRASFYNPLHFALLPMAFCYPGSGPSGDQPPPVACAATWRAPLLAELRQLSLTVLLGQYAIAWHLPGRYPSLGAAASDWRAHWPRLVPLPHPSPRNIRWLRRNPWFEADLLPPLRQRVDEILAQVRSSETAASTIIGRGEPP